MSFTLEVEFSGLCLYLLHPDGTQIGIVMPDGRTADDKNAPDLTHLDGTPAKSHVGYLRFDLANTGAFPQKETRKHPTYEAIHLFNFEELDFGLGDHQPLKTPELHVPDVGEFASLLDTVPKLFTDSPPPELLMRTILQGGSIDSNPADELWTIDTKFNAKKTTVKGKFAGFSTWTRRVDASQLVLRIKNWKGIENSVIVLRPNEPEGTIKLTVANLCAENPMEWPELGLRVFGGPVDDDFKWFYRLLKHPKGPFQTLTSKAKPLPAPILDKNSPKSEGGTPNCSSLKFSHPF